jgi:hypothetical protein
MNGLLEEGRQRMMHVRRQSFWDGERLKIRARRFVMLCGLTTVHQAAIDDCLSFDPFSFDQNGLAAAEVDVSRHQILS